MLFFYARHIMLDNNYLDIIMDRKQKEKIMAFTKPFMNNNRYMDYRCNRIKDTEIDPTAFGLVITGDNRDYLREIWGKETFRFRGEVLYSVWVRMVREQKMVLVISSNKGTSYEISEGDRTHEEFQNDDHLGDVMIEFVNDLFENLMTCQEAHEHYHRSRLSDRRLYPRQERYFSGLQDGQRHY